MNRRLIYFPILAVCLHVSASITLAQYLPPVEPLTARSDHHEEDHSHHYHVQQNLQNINLSGANLTSTDFWSSTLTDANLSGANLTRAYLNDSTLTDADLSGANLTDARLYGSTLTSANLSGAVVTSADFSDTTSRGFTQAQLQSTASYQTKDLKTIGLAENNLSGWNLSGQDLTKASFNSSTLTDVDLNGAIVRGANFLRAVGLSFRQIESTASYQAKNLQEIGLSGIDLSAWDFSGQDLTKASSMARRISNATTDIDTNG